MSATRPGGPQFVPEWDVYRDKDGEPVTITWEQIKAIWHAVAVVNLVRTSEGCKSLFESPYANVQTEMSKSRLLGRMLIDGLPPTRARPPPELGGPEWCLLPGGDPFGKKPAARVRVDLNVRIGGDVTFAGFEDVEGADPAGLAEKAWVEAYEAETGAYAPAYVAKVDAGRELVYLTIDWAQFRQAPEGWESER